MQKYKVIYDFSAQQGSSELSILQGDIVTVTNTDVGEGWWEGTNENGEHGLFPASYVELCTEPNQTSSKDQAQHNLQSFVQQSTHENANAPSTRHSTQSIHSIRQQQQQQHNTFLAPTQASDFKLQPQQSTTEEPDWPDEDWDDDDDSDDNMTDYQGSQRGFPMGSPPYYGTGHQTGTGQTHAYPNSDIHVAAANLALADTKTAQPSPAVPIKSKRNFNRFSNFVKSGLESYILEAKTIDVPIESMVQIRHDPELGIVWKPNLNQYTCALTKHGKESKMKGFKTFISYEITPSTSNIVVRRRYKHFDWLMQRLEEKFIVTPLPQLPEKQIAGRFQEDFVEHRRNLLQLWMNYITRHPVLSQCDVWWHFITCSTDDLKGWKNGKRKAEKDELVGANFFFSISVDSNTVPLDAVKTTKQLDNFQRFVAKFDDAVKHMFNTTVEQSKKFSTGYAKDYKKLSESIKGLSSAFQSGTAWLNSLGLNEAIRQTSAAYEEVSKLHEEEPKFDFEPMADMLHQYRGLLSGWPEILQLHKNTVNRRSEFERLAEEGKLSDSELARVNQRANVITYATLAEINHFHNERLVDFRQMMQVFLTAQINFHSDIVSKLQTALNKINNA